MDNETKGLAIVAAVACGVVYGFYSAIKKLGQVLGWVEKKAGNDWAGNALLILWVPFLMLVLAEISKGVSVATNVVQLSTCPHPGPTIQRTWYCVMKRTDVDDWHLRNQQASTIRARLEQAELERQLQEQSDLEFATSLRALATDVAPASKPGK